MSAGDQEKKADAQQEIELVEKIRKYDRRAFCELITLYQKKIFRFAYGFLDNREDAMEIVQETFIRFYEKIGQWREGTSLAPWLYRIAQNLCIDHYRKHHKQKKLTDPLDDVWEKEISSLWPEGEQNEQEQLLILVDQSLESLSDRQRTVFIMKHQEGKKLEEIAAALGTTVGTIKTLHHRAIRKIRRGLLRYVK